MNTLKITLFCVLFLACNNASNSFSQDNLSPEKIIENFFIKYDSEGPESALNLILSTNQWINTNSTGIIKSISDLVNEIGTYHGSELIVKRSIGDNYKLWSYMLKYDRQPIRFQFIFYKPSNLWQLQDFRYDDDLEVELIEAAKAYRLLENMPLDNNN